MARWATVIEIAGVILTGCRGKVIDGEQFITGPYAGSVEQGNDGTVDVQVVDRGVRGIQFGLSLTSTEEDKLSDIFAAISAAEALQEGIVIEITDGLIVIDVSGGPDYSQKWFNYSKYSEGWYEDVVLRFVSHVAN